MEKIAKRNELKRLVSFAFAFIALGMLWPQKAFALGVAPSEIKIDALSVGQVFEVDFFVTRKNPSKDETVNLILTGDLFENTKEKRRELLLPKEQKEVRVFTKINTVDLSPGEIKGIVSVNPISSENDSLSIVDSTRIVSGSSLTVSAEIVDGEKIDYRYGNLSVSSNEDGELFFYPELYNNGTVPYRFERAEIVIIDENKNEVARESISGSSSSYVLPGKNDRLTFSFPLNLNPGNYSANVAFYRKGRIEDERNVIFKINNKSAVNIFLNKNISNWVYVFFVIFIVFTFGLLFMIKLRKNK